MLRATQIITDTMVHQFGLLSDEAYRILDHARDYLYAQEDTDGDDYVSPQ